MRSRTARALTVIAAAASLVATGLVTTPAHARIRIVEPGESIQDAINASSPGDTVVVKPGVYQEYLSITKNDITLRGSGASLEGTILEPPATPNANLADKCVDPEFGPSSGICVMGNVNFESGQVARYVRGARISGFHIQNFPAFGVFGMGARNLVVRHVHAEGMGEYGIAAFSSTGTRFLYNTLVGNDFAGFYFGDSPEADAVARGNVSQDNVYGAFIRSASHGKIVDNKFSDSCLGMLFFEGPNRPRDWTVRGNDVFRNNKMCPGDPTAGEPAISGAGIVLFGAAGIRVEANRVWNNVPTGEAQVAGGILLISGSRRITVVDNVAYGNQPGDIVWDGSGAENRFPNNKCGVSMPARICN